MSCQCHPKSRRSSSPPDHDPEDDRHRSSSARRVSPTTSSTTTSGRAAPAGGWRRPRPAAMRMTSSCSSTSFSNGMSIGATLRPPHSAMFEPGASTGKVTSDQSAIPLGSARRRRSVRSTRGPPHGAFSRQSRRASTAHIGASQTPGARTRAASRSSGSPLPRLLNGSTSVCVVICLTVRSIRAIGTVRGSATVPSCEPRTVQGYALRSSEASSLVRNGRRPQPDPTRRFNSPTGSRKVASEDPSGHRPKRYPQSTLTSAPIAVSPSKLPTVAASTRTSQTCSHSRKGTVRGSHTTQRADVSNSTS